MHDRGGPKRTITHPTVYSNTVGFFVCISARNDFIKLCVHKRFHLFILLPSLNET